MPSYNPYMPVSYGYNNPYMTPQYSMNPNLQMQPMSHIQQPQMQMGAPTQEQAPPVSSPASIIWVANERAALEYPVIANSAVALWDQSAPVIYLKKADASGKPTTQIFDLVERVDRSQNDVGTHPVDLSIYASKNDMASLAGVVSKLSKDIDAMKEELARMASQAVKRAVGAKMKRPEREEEEEDAE